MDIKNTTWEYYYLDSDNYSITQGQYVIYKFTIIKRKSYSSYITGILGIGADTDEVYIDIENKQTSQISNATNAVLILQPKTTFIRY